MARRPRVFAPHLLYHVIVRGNQRQATFLTPDDYHAYLDRLAKYRRECQVRLWAYCLMPNHVHLLLETAGAPLSAFMQGLQQSYTQYFNRTHRKVGHLFQGRYKAILCEKDRYLVALIRYIHLNPVRARLVEQPEAYAYSGHVAYLAGRATEVLDPMPGLAVFGGAAAYRQFVREGLAEGHQADYYAVTDQRFLGAERFVEQWQAQEVESRPSPPRQALPAAMKAVAVALGVEPGALRSADRSWALSQQRTQAAYVLVRRLGFRVRDVAVALGRDATTMSVLLTRLAVRLREKPAARQHLDRLVKKVKI
jgi:REP element-mobilizing transposase RayT